MFHASETCVELPQGKLPLTEVTRVGTDVSDPAVGMPLVSLQNAAVPHGVVIA